MTVSFWLRSCESYAAVYADFVLVMITTTLSIVYGKNAIECHHQLKCVQYLT